MTSHRLKLPERMVSLLCVATFLLLAAAAPATAAEPATLYDTGLAAFNRGDYATAAEWLFAYRFAAAGTLKADFAHQVDEALNYAEQQVRVAVQTKEELDKHGKVTRVTVSASGKADGFGGSSKEQTKPIQLPASVALPKPNLPTAPAMRDSSPAQHARAYVRADSPQTAHPATPGPPGTNSPGTAMEEDLKKQITALQQKVQGLKLTIEQLQTENQKLKAQLKGQ